MHAPAAVFPRVPNAQQQAHVQDLWLPSPGLGAQVGWGKALTYAVGISKDGVCDVTRR